MYYKEILKVKLSVTKKRTYYGKPPLTEDEVNEMVKKKTKLHVELLREAMEILTGKRKSTDLSPQFREFAHDYIRGEAGSHPTPRRNKEIPGRKRRDLLHGPAPGK